MEGLIPMFYRAIKKNRVRRQYSALSPEASQSYNYNIDDFYVNPPPCHIYPKDQSAEERQKGHRRYKSFGGAAGKESSGGGKGGHGPPRQLVRFRSQRILSCLTGNGH